MNIFDQKILMDKKLLHENPSMFYLKIGALIVGAYLLGKMTRR